MLQKKIEYLKNKIERVKPLLDKYEKFSKAYILNHPESDMIMKAWKDVEAAFEEQVISNNKFVATAEPLSEDPEYTFWFRLHLTYMSCTMFLHLLEKYKYEDFDEEIDIEIALWEKAEFYLLRLRKKLRMWAIKDAIVVVLAASFLILALAKAKYC